MRGDRKQILAVTFMLTSLIFLAGFLVLFLKSSYNKEKENIQKEVGYLFVNSVRKIEGGILNKLVFQGDSTKFGQIHFPRVQKDSVKIRSVFTVKDHKVTTGNGNFEIEVKHEGRSNNLNQLEGSVAMFIALNLDSTQVDDSCATVFMKKDFFTELEDNFRKNIESANLPVTYTLQRENQQSSNNKEDILTGSYTDISSGEKYKVNIDKYGFLIIKRILPEFIFSLLLFSCIALAFYLVYKSLASEKMLLNIKNDFIQNITHELKTPIATVSVALEALQDFNVRDDPQKRLEYLDISKNELKRLSLLVDKVLNISQIEKELPENTLVQLKLDLVIKEILNTLKLQFEKLNVKVNFNCIGEDFTIMGDRQHIDGLLYNLLDNAMKYNSNPKPEIDIQLMQENSQIKITIADNGIGIAQEHQRNVFEKFYRVPQGNIHNIKGHGLGLSYVAQVVKEMGGIIYLESKESIGSVFSILIPKNANI